MVAEVAHEGNVVIEAKGLTKRYGSKVAVNDLSFEVHPGRVTGFLGPNGSGKSTTMRLMLQLDRAETGQTLFDGQRYADIQYPTKKVGSLLEAHAVHPKVTARNHLRVLAAANRIPETRIDQVFDQVGMADAADRRTGGFSLGMFQRLGLATALLGRSGNTDPGRTDERPRPGGDPLDPCSLEAARGRRQDRVHLQSPARRDGRDRRRSRRDRARQIDRADGARRFHRECPSRCEGSEPAIG